VQILKELEKPGQAVPARRALIRKLLDFGSDSTADIAAELRDGTWVPVVEPVRIVAPGSGGVPLLIRNPGKIGCWFRPGLSQVFVDRNPLGVRPGKTAETLGWSVDQTDEIFDGLDDPREAVIVHLAGLVRIPPGGQAVFGTSEAFARNCGSYRLSGVRIAQTGQLDAEFQGRTLHIPEAEPEALPSAICVVLGEIASDSLAARIVRDGEGWALEVTSSRDLPAMEVHETFDNYWWAAEGAGGAWLESGAMLSTPEERAAWKKGETRRVPLRATLPKGARRIWLGLDQNFSNTQVVAAPVEIEEGK